MLLPPSIHLGALEILTPIIHVETSFFGCSPCLGAHDIAVLGILPLSHIPTLPGRRHAVLDSRMEAIRAGRRVLGTRSGDCRARDEFVDEIV